MEEKFIIVTGAYGGLGKEVCKALCEDYSLILIDKEENKEFTEELREISSRRIICFKIDFLTSENLKLLTDFLTEENLLIKGVILAAGIMKKGKLENTSLEDWDETIKVNLTSNFVLCKAIIPFLKKQRAGSIIFIGSVLGKVASYDLFVYSVTKAALVHFSKNLALELMDYGISVNCISPGFMDTTMYSEFSKNNDLNRNWFHLFGGLKNKTIEIEDVIKTIDLLLKQKSMSGENIIIDYGYSIR